ncbi:FdhF/YdeP family oxidoreductase [Glaciecola petra]|uniref:FdhF/YdeP family oxidoreductase n=1 Tax=Glaciecola petra TaxID=3075602 RepID=A0ABU2ZUS4_9ALTE|nr:FdhF/YdeP family oxidoreductase [Aestuariibacter sp. P117]MDT0596151.1 FdhF/YdeP family oxidoreductase [Aestuariibacter sp. P117]
MAKIKKPNKAGGMHSVNSAFKQVLQSKRVKSNIKNLLKVNKDGGFDCPGCAWGDSEEGFVHFCENGAKAIAWESTERKLTNAFFQQHTVSKLKKQSDYWLEYQGRLSQPMRYNAKTDKYEPTSWDGAITLIKNHLIAVESPDQVEFYTSGRASNEASYLYQLFGRVFGTNNFPDCSNMCHEASGVALKESIGVGKGTVVLDDFYKADAIFVFGQNPGTNHPRMMSALRKAAKGGCKIVSINNLKEIALQKFASPQQPLELLTGKSTSISQLYLTPKLGTDFALIRGIAKTIIDKFPNAIDKSFIEAHTIAFENYVKAVKQTEWSQIEEQTGVSKARIAEAAEIFAHSEKVISTWAMGITQHKHSVATIKELSNLHLMMGQIGKEGAGLSPVRGHSNVQGNRTMGINEKPSLSFLNKLSAQFDIPMPQKMGHNVQSALTALYEKRSSILICLGGNLAAAAPDTQYTAEAMSQAKLNVQISTKLNRSHLMVSKDALILPCLGRTEIDIQGSGPQQITVEDTFSMVHASAGTSAPPSEYCLSETDIIARIANAVLKECADQSLKKIDWLALRDDYSLIRNLIANSIDGFVDFNQKLKQKHGFHLANSAANRQWNTQSGKATFSACDIPSSLYSEQTDNLIAAYTAKKEQVFTLQSLRSHDQYNTTIYGMDDRYRGIKNQRKVLFINENDAKKMHLQEGQRVEIESIWEGNTTRKINDFKLVFYDIPRGNVAAYYPETNPLVPINSVGDHSYTPTSKSIPVVIRASLNTKIIDIITN